MKPGRTMLLWLTYQKFFSRNFLSKRGLSMLSSCQKMCEWRTSGAMTNKKVKSNIKFESRGPFLCSMNCFVAKGVQSSKPAKDFQFILWSHEICNKQKHCRSAEAAVQTKPKRLWWMKPWQKGGAKKIMLQGVFSISASWHTLTIIPRLILAKAHPPCCAPAVEKGTYVQDMQTRGNSFRKKVQRTANSSSHSFRRPENSQGKQFFPDPVVEFVCQLAPLFFNQPQRAALQGFVGPRLAIIL